MKYNILKWRILKLYLLKTQKKSYKCIIHGNDNGTLLSEGCFSQFHQMFVVDPHTFPFVFWTHAISRKKTNLTQKLNPEKNATFLKLAF